MTHCQTCQKDCLKDNDTQRLFDEYPYKPHRCSFPPRPIPRFAEMNGVLLYRRPEEIALAITNEAVRCFMDPYKVKVEVRGDFLILH